MKIHKEFCPIYLASIGRYNSTATPCCNCDGFTQSDGSSPSVQPKELPETEKIQKSQQLNIIEGNDGLYVIKKGRLIKVVQILFPYGQPNFVSTGSDLKRYILEDGEIIETYE